MKKYLVSRLINETPLVYCMYANYVVIVTKSVSDLQLALNTPEKYCYESSLEVNVNKTKVIVV